MTKEKQIVEMARDICPYANEYTDCKQCDTDLDIGGEPCLYKIMANSFATKGYRKAEDVAREIFAEIIELAKNSADEAKMRADKETNVLLRAELRGQQIGGNLMLYKLAELKKKYESEEKERD